MPYVEVIPEWYWIVSEEPDPDLVRGLPSPAAGRLVELGIEVPVGRDGQQTGFLGLAWDLPDGRRMVAMTDGYTALPELPEPATWLPRGFPMEYLVPIGFTWAHLGRWLDEVIDDIVGRAEAEKRATEAHLVPGLTSHARDLVAAAYLIVRHLGLPGSPQEPRRAIDRHGCVAALRDVREFLRRAMPPAPTDIPPRAEAPGVGPPPTSPSPHRDGPEREGWLWWQDRRRKVPGGVIYRLIEYMWDRDEADYADLFIPRGSVFEADMDPDSISRRTNDANKELEKIGVPWWLKAEPGNGRVIKVRGQRPGRKRIDD
jgi:hypothetical protein